MTTERIYSPPNNITEKPPLRPEKGTALKTNYDLINAWIACGYHFPIRTSEYKIRRTALVADRHELRWAGILIAEQLHDGTVRVAENLDTSVYAILKTLHEILIINHGYYLDGTAQPKPQTLDDKLDVIFGWGTKPVTQNERDRLRAWLNYEDRPDASFESNLMFMGDGAYYLGWKVAMRDTGEGAKMLTGENDGSWIAGMCAEIELEIAVHNVITKASRNVHTTTES